MGEALEKKTSEQTRQSTAIEQGEQGGYISLKPILPPGHTFPNTDEHPLEHKDARLREAEYVCDIKARPEEFAVDLSHQNKAGASSYYIHHENGSWLVPKATPANVLSIIKAALSHEASINPTMGELDGHASVRLITPQNKKHWEGGDSSSAHFDGPKDARLSAYIVASSPTTIQYTGPVPEYAKNKYPYTVAGHTSAKEWYEKARDKDSIMASSLLPMKLYRITDKTLHSSPWELFPVSEKEGSEGPRFFCRVSFFLPNKL